MEEITHSQDGDSSSSNSQAPRLQATSTRSVHHPSAAAQQTKEVMTPTRGAESTAPKRREDERLRHARETPSAHHLAGLCTMTAQTTVSSVRMVS